MTLSRTTLLSSVLFTATTIVAGAVWMHQRSPAAASSPSRETHEEISAAVRACELVADQELTFDLVTRQSAMMDTTGLARSLSNATSSSVPVQVQTAPQKGVIATMSARIHLRALTTADDPNTVAAVVLRNQDMSIDGKPAPAREELSEALLVKIAPDCRITDYAHPSSINAGAARTQEALVAALSWDLEPRRGRYEVSQRDGLGLGQVRYTAATASRATTVRRTLVSLSEVSRGLPGVPVRIISSSAEAQLGTQPFFDTMAARDEIEQRSPQGISLRTERTQRITRVDAAGADPFAGVDLSLDRYIWGDHLGDKNEPIRPDPTVDPSAALSVNEAIDKMSATLDTLGDLGPRAVASMLAKAIQARPALAIELVAKLKAGKIDAKSSTAMLFGLQKSERPEARDALLSVAKDSAFRPNDRVGAVVHVTQMKVVNTDTVDELKKLAKATTDKMGLASTATLSIGALGRSRQGLDPEVSKLATREIETHLRDEKNPARMATWLTAASNSADPVFSSEISRLSSADDPTVRAAAVESMLRIPGMYDELGSRIASEQDPTVQQAVFNAVAHSGKIATGAVLDTAVGLLSTDETTVATNDLVQVVGSASASSPVARQALIDRFHRERDPNVLAAIGRYIPANELR